MPAGDTRTRDQLRAADALARAQQVAGETESALKRGYRAYVERLGPAILMNGLGQALASELAAAGGSGHDRPPEQRAHHLLYTHLSGWLCGEHGAYPEGRDLLESLVDNGQDAYVRAQAEALVWLTWHKKFCRAELPKPAPGRDGTEGG